MSKALKITSTNGLFDLEEAEDRLDVTGDSIFPDTLYLRVLEMREGVAENEASIYLDADQALWLADTLTQLANDLLFARREDAV